MYGSPFMPFIHSILDLESLFKPYVNDLQDILY